MKAKAVFAAICLLTFAGLGNAQEADMEAFMALAKPGEKHEMLHKMIGNWTSKTKVWMQPGAPPMESTGAMKGESMLDGRFVRATWTGEMMDMPFTGIGINGYDNQKQKFTNVWIDSMGTMTMMFEGDCSNDDCSSTTMSSTFVDPMTGTEMTMRMTSTWNSEDEFSVVSQMVLPDGNEFKNMEMRVTRE